MPQRFPVIFDSSSSSVESLGELQLIEQIRQWLGPVAPLPPEGMGDDCAVLPVPSSASSSAVRQLLTTDSISYGQHFNDSISPEDAGAKLIKRNLSDIAAMGGTAGPALLNLLCGPDLSINWLHAFVTGIRKSCECYKVLIVGGDMSELAPGHFSAALTLTGTCTHPPALRSTAGVGDSIYVTGSLGGSILGKHYRFEPRLAEGQWLARKAECTAMMDLTDGLGKDLAAVLPSNSSAEIRISALPVSQDARQCSEADGVAAEAHAFSDGEDYELVFTIDGEADHSTFESEWRERFPELQITKIGQIRPKRAEGIYIDAESGQALPWQSGFEHFKQE